MTKIFLLLIFKNIIFMQGLKTDDSAKDRILIEVDDIENNYISMDNSQFPLSVKKRNKNPINLVSNFSKKLSISPVIAFRYSKNGFGLDPNYNSTNVLWYTPGLTFDYKTPFISSYSGLWIHLWGRFYKHATFGIDGLESSLNNNYFYFSPDFSFPYYSNSEFIGNSIEFDESFGGLALVNSDNHISFGKMRSRIGPFHSSNLIISSQTPAFPQFNASMRLNNNFSIFLLAGQLETELVDSNLVANYKIDGISMRTPMLKRYIFLHRLNFSPIRNLRFSFTEFVIAGNAISWSYFNPFTFYWSEEHSNGDLDNIFLGLDYEWIVKPFKFYGSFLLDEWKPEKTFSTDNQNWYGIQLGFSFAKNFSNNKILFKIEYSYLTPQIYSHKFAINKPLNYGNSLGFWSGGNSKEYFVLINYQIAHYRQISLQIRKNKSGDSIYKSNVLLPSYDYDLNSFNIIYSDLLFSNIIYEVDISKFDISGKMNIDKGLGVDLKILYNISY